ncbi:GntR family transcriptional regulator [Isoptericola sp. BMS4]|uniref:GntR family transcriptional regulator n=1 Tax=Isoptericola sp. BMS4 TaxID=2527875 RepID=UPI00141EBF7C|nr:GntR family transcriptional regulator [Isoptericola sp. BMS4]
MSLDVTPLKQTALGERVAQELRRLIVRGQLPADTHLVEAQLSTDFGVSRGPIRDALRRLEAEGLVETRSRGTYVVGLTDSDIAELFSLRATLESFALRLCADRGDADWSRLHAALDDMRAAADAGDATEFAIADLRFHSLFYEIAGHRRLMAIWRDNEPTFRSLVQITTARDTDLHPSAESHAAILRLLEDGEIEPALTELSAHLDGSSRRMREARRELVDASR